jgi:phage terminase large subunit-like protein
MGRRGPGAGRLRKVAALATEVSHPWEQEGMPPDEKMLAFLRSLPIVSGLKAGATLELLGFQEQFVRGVYGPDDAEQRRIVRLAALSVARGNGKSALLAGPGSLGTSRPHGEPYGEIYAAALDREQAGVLYRMTRALHRGNAVDGGARQHPRLAQGNRRRGNAEPMAGAHSDARKAHGLAPSFWIADEVAQWKSRELWDNLATGMGKRDQALGVTISTQARERRSTSLARCWTRPPCRASIPAPHGPEDCELDRPRGVGGGKPGAGRVPQRRPIRGRGGAGDALPVIRAGVPQLLHLNQRVAPEGRFINAGDWDANGEPFDPLELEGKRCFGGLDLGSTSDLTAFVLWFPDEGKVLAWHFVPKERIAERVERDRVPYDRWAKDGHILTPRRARHRPPRNRPPASRGAPSL